MKLRLVMQTIPVVWVALRAGAWIETEVSADEGEARTVALRAGAWIETRS